jgi:hypothetical protein
MAVTEFSCLGIYLNEKHFRRLIKKHAEEKLLLMLMSFSAFNQGEII